MIIIKIDALLFWTILSGIGGLAGVIALVIPIAKNKQRKREELERSCDELCSAVSNSKIHTLLNNIIAICNKGTNDAKGIIEVQNELRIIYQEASTKWDALKSRLTAKKHKELLDKLEAVFRDYQSCAKDAETIVVAIGRGDVEEVKQFLSKDNSQEIRAVISAASEIYENDLYGFVKQIISLRFKDLEISDYASQIRALMNDSYQDNNVLETQLLARIGNAKAQRVLGMYYYNKKQFRQAFSWFEKSAKQGDAQAQFSLGVCYHEGTGCDQNDDKAFEWYEKSAKQGVPKAQCTLGTCYADGIGCEQNDDKAFEWYEKSAKQGDAQAQYNLGCCYYEGTGCDQNYNQAFRWFTNASQDKQNINLYSDAIFNIGIMYSNGSIGFGDDFTAVNYFKIAAQFGHAPAQYQLGVCYESGIGVKEVDIKEAKYWYGEAAKQGSEDAIASLERLSAK